MRRHLRKMLFGISLVVFLSPEECAFVYCLRHNFNPPICDIFELST